jgi:hypothetical protein
MQTEKILLTISIDTECDHSQNWARSNPLTFQSINDGIPNKLQPVFNDVGAIPTYLLTVEVMENEKCVNTLKNIQGKHELGTHLHAGFIEPNKKHYDYAGIDCPDFQCNYEEDIEYKKLVNLTDLFEECFSYKPKIFRAGRFGANNNTINSLEKLGYLVDTSVTPHILWKEGQGNVDFRNAPEQVYFPAKNNIIELSKYVRPLLEIPVTVKKRFLRRNPRWFRPWFSTVDQMKEVVYYHLKKYRGQKVIVINMMFHSMEVIPKASPYPQINYDVAIYLDNLAEILNWAKTEGIIFSSMENAYNEIID